MDADLLRYLTDDERAILEAAERATPGPWEFDNGENGGGPEIYQPLIDNGPCVFGIHSYRTVDVDHVVAANPSVVLSLLSSLATARAQAATRHSEVSSTESTWVDLCPYHDSMLADAYRRGVEDAAIVASTYEGNAWTEEKQRLLDGRAKAIRALSPKANP